MSQVRGFCLGLCFFFFFFLKFYLCEFGVINNQVSGFLGGERDYINLKGDTGPLVYPAGFLYVYSAIQYVTGGEVYAAQVI